MTTIYDLSEDVRRWFLAGYALEEMDMYRLRNDSKKLEKVAASYPVPVERRPRPGLAGRRVLHQSDHRAMVTS